MDRLFFTESRFRTEIDPPCGFINPVMRRIRVVFPAPSGPSSPTISPADRRKETSSTAANGTPAESGNIFRTFRQSIRGWDSVVMAWAVPGAVFRRSGPGGW